MPKSRRSGSSELYEMSDGKHGAGLFSWTMYNLLNFVMGVSAIWVTIVSGSWIFGVLIALISKWRIFAVAPRYWWANIKANLVDIIVRVSLVMLTYFAGAEIGLEHIVLMVIFVVWLLFIKPRTSALAVEIQALTATFLGLSVVGTGAVILQDLGVGFEICLIMIVLAGFVIGYGALRHIMFQSEDYEFNLQTLVWGLVIAELSWMLFHRSIIYYIGVIAIPQLAIVATLISYVVFRVYRSVTRHGGKMVLKEVAGPIVFTVLTLVVVLILFSSQRLSY